MVLWTKGTRKRSSATCRAPRGHERQSRVLSDRQRRDPHALESPRRHRRDAPRRRGLLRRRPQRRHRLARRPRNPRSEDPQPGPLPGRGVLPAQRAAVPDQPDAGVLDDPAVRSGLKIEVRQATIEERDTTRRNIFGLTFTDLETGEPILPGTTSRAATWWCRRKCPGVLLPVAGHHHRGPLGPLESVNFGGNRVSGFHIFTTWDIFDLIGVERPRSRPLEPADRLPLGARRRRGHRVSGSGKSIFGIPAKHEALRARLGPVRQGRRHPRRRCRRQIFITPDTVVPVSHPDWRAVSWADGTSKIFPGLQRARAAFLSDRNFLEQFYQNEFHNDLNQETSLYVKQQIDRWAWSLWSSASIGWVTETEWLPRAAATCSGRSSSTC